MGCKGGRMRLGETVIGTRLGTGLTERLSPADAMVTRSMLVCEGSGERLSEVAGFRAPTSLCRLAVMDE